MVAAAAGVIEGVPISYVTVAHSLSSLQAVSDDIASRRAALAADGINVISWGPDDATDTLQIGLNPYTDGAASSLKASYGDLVSVIPHTVEGGGSSRTNDTSPFWGGDEMDGPTGSCSLWFAVYDHTFGVHVPITAGHCGAGTYTIPDNGDVVAHVTSSMVHFGGFKDAERGDSVGSAHNVWAGPNARYRSVTSYAASPVVGTHVCNDGYADGENCNVEINSLGQSLCYDGECINSLMGAGSSSGNAFTPGDSGGPVYSKPSSLGTNGAHVKAYGMIVAWEGSYKSGYIETAGNVLASFSDDITVLTS